MAAPVYDNSATSSASGGVSNTLTQSWTQDVGAGANNCGIIAVTCTNSGSAQGVVTGTPTASIGGTSLPYLGTVLYNNLAIGGFTAVFGTLGVPTGLGKTVTYSITDSGQNFGNAFGTSYTYTGVSSIGALQTAFGSAGLASVAVPSATGHLVWGALANYQGGVYTGFTLTQRQGQGAAAPAFVAGDGAGASSVTVSGTSTAGAFGAVGLDLLPVTVTTPTNLFFLNF